MVYRRSQRVFNTARTKHGVVKCFVKDCTTQDANKKRALLLAEGGIIKAGHKEKLTQHARMWYCGASSRRRQPICCNRAEMLDI